MSDDDLKDRQLKLTIFSQNTSFGLTSTGGQANTIEINGGDDSSTPDVPGMRVVAKIAKTSEKDPNTSQITVYNLNPDHRAALQTKGVKVTLEAGYRGPGLSRIFIGDVRTVDHVIEAGDAETVMKLGEGERSYRFARLTKTWSAGTGAGTVLRDLANATGLAIGNIPDVVANLSTTFDSGYAVHGPVSDSLDRLVKSLGYVWSVQDETLQVLNPGATAQGDAQIPEISEDTGLVGSPEVGAPEKKGQPGLVGFKCLLRPVIPGGKVRLKSKRYDGELRVKRATFDLDTHGQPWYTTIEGVIIKS